MEHLNKETALIHIKCIQFQRTKHLILVLEFERTSRVIKLTKISWTKKSQKWWKLPSDGHRFGCAVAGDNGDESREVRVLVTKNKTKTHVHLVSFKMK